MRTGAYECIQTCCRSVVSGVYMCMRVSACLCDMHAATIVGVTMAVCAYTSCVLFYVAGSVCECRCLLSISE